MFGGWKQTKSGGAVFKVIRSNTKIAKKALVFINEVTASGSTKVIAHYKRGEYTAVTGDVKTAKKGFLQKGKLPNSQSKPYMDTIMKWIESAGEAAYAENFD